MAEGAGDDALDPSTRALIERAGSDGRLRPVRDRRGSGGVRASRIAAAYGAKVAIAEEYKVGGTCVIRGCVPKKLLVYGAHFAEDLEDAAMFGWDVPTSASTGRCCATMCWPRSGGSKAPTPRR